MRFFSKSELLPAYGPAEAARYVQLSVDKARRWADALSLPEESAFPLSFANLLQLQLLKAMRVEHGVPLQRVRRVLPELRQRYGSQFPLLQKELLTDGLDLFLQDDGGYTNLSQTAQRGFQEHFQLYLRRIDLDGKVAKLYPFVQRNPRADAATSIVIRPDVGFGRPVVDGTGIHTRVVASRFHGGESIADLLEEYRLSPQQMDEVLRWETQLRADAA